jgi:hypothetical protein
MDDVMFGLALINGAVWVIIIHGSLVRIRIQLSRIADALESEP